MAKRVAINLAGRRLSLLGFGGPGRPLLALHGHFAEGRTFTRLARELGYSCRVIALDQRGHGHSDRPSDFSRSGYVEDAAAVLERLGAGGAVVLGHSLGGVNAYQLAARHPGLVDALVVEDVGAEVDGDLSFCRSWPHRTPTRSGLLEGLGPSAGHLMDAVREYPDGWGLAFGPAGHDRFAAAAQRGPRERLACRRLPGAARPGQPQQSPRRGARRGHGGTAPSYPARRTPGRAHRPRDRAGAIRRSRAGVPPVAVSPAR